MRHCRPFSMLLVLAVGVAALVACSGDSPFAASGRGQGVVLKGTVLGVAASSSSVSAQSFSAAGGDIIVTVQENPAITTKVGPDGSFTLRGLPEGSFTLVFTRDGAVLGTLTFAAVKPNQEITITVDVSSGVVVLVEERRDGIGNGDLEIEGKVEAVLALDMAGDSRFRIRGYTVVARPGQTAIREGNTRRTVEDVTVGRQVHVKGVWLPAGSSGQAQEVLAYEIKLQGDEDEEDTPGGVCMISGGKVGQGIQLEGNVESGSAASFMLRVKGNRATGLVQVDAGGASIECHPKSGPNAPTPDQCKAKVTAGAQVHVSGTLKSCDASAATVEASRVIVQK